LEQLENRTLLSGGCDAPQCPNVNLPPTLPDGPPPNWIDQWYAWNQSAEWNVGDYLNAFGDFAIDAIADGADDWLQSSLDESEFGDEFSDRRFTELAFDAAPGIAAKLDEPPGRIAEHAWQNEESDSSWRGHDRFDSLPGDNNFVDLPPSGTNLDRIDWIGVDLDPVEPPSRPPREILRPPVGPIIIPPSYGPTPVSATVAQPTSLSLISSPARRIATDDASSHNAGNSASTEDASPEIDSQSAEDVLAESAAGDASCASTQETHAAADGPAARSANSSAKAPTAAATACDVVVAGAFAVVLSPPISRLLAAGAAPFADDAIGGTIQALWAWLRRRKAKRSGPNDAPNDSNASDECYETVDAAIGDSFDALTSRSNLALAGGAGVAGVAAIASVWSHCDPSRSAGNGRSTRKLDIPITDGPTRVR
jgi:hypothetical protein